MSEPSTPLTSAGEPDAVTSPPKSPEPGAEVDQVVGRLDHLAVVFDQDQRVSQVAQPAQGVQEPGIVAWVEADGRLVEDVQHARQAAADLTRQPDALGFPPRERRRPAPEAEVVEPDVVEELEPVANLADEVAGDVLLVLRHWPAW